MLKGSLRDDTGNYRLWAKKARKIVSNSILKTKAKFGGGLVLYASFVGYFWSIIIINCTKMQ